MNTNLIEDIEAVVADSCRVEVETATAAGLFEPAADCEVERIVRAADGAVEYALLRVRPAAGQDVLGMWSRARRVAVSVRCGDVERYVFCGCPVTTEWQVGGQASQGERVLLRVEGTAAGLRRCADLVVIGRFARTRSDWSAEEGGDRVARVGGLECLFGPDGRANCAAAPIRVRLRDGSTQEIHVFTHEDDPDAQAWTVSRAMRYLAWFHLREHPWLDVEWLLRATAASAAAAAESREYLRAGQPMEWALRGMLTGFAAEGLSAVDALSRLVKRAGLHWHIEPVGSGGTVRCEVRIWSQRCGPARCLSLADAREGALPGGGNASEGEIVSCTLRRDLAAGVERAVVVGDVKYHEVTVELVPGWVPEPAVDAVPYSQRATVKGQALLDEDIEALGEEAALDPWYQKYHRKGSAFAAHQDTGRKWVLNEHGRYVPALYNRYAPFADYQPYRFAKVLSREAADAERWLVRPRRLLPLITQASSGAVVALAVEVSFDGGGTWSAYTGPVRVLKEECGLVIDANNLCEITPAGQAASQRNLWYSLIDQQARLRVTAVIEGDERVEAAASTGGAACWGSGVVLQADRQLPYASAAGAVNVLRAARLDGADVDSRPAAREMAEAALDGRAGFAFEAVLAGLRLDVELGQRVWGLWRTGTQMCEGSFESALPAVRAIEYVGGGRLLTKVSAT